MESLSERLKYLRKSKKLTMEQLTDKLNEKYNSKINKSMISKWENGIGEPSLDSARILANFFETTLDYMLGIEPLTVAAHHDGEDWTEEELQELEDFKRYVLSKRQK